MSIANPSLEDQAIATVSQRKFHQIFQVPGTDKHGPLKITYAVLGLPAGEDVPTIVFCAGMFGSRYTGIFANWMAEREGVRILLMDRLVFYHSYNPEALIAHSYEVMLSRSCVWKAVSRRFWFQLPGARESTSRPDVAPSRVCLTSKKILINHGLGLASEAQLLFQ